MWRRYLTFWGRDIDRDLEAELDFHLEARKTELIDEGWSPVDARREAERLLGNLQGIHNECAGVDRLREVEMKRADYLEQLRQDVGYALREFGRSPGFAIVAIVTLALGIGANTAIFSVVNAVLLKPLPYATDGVYTLWQQEAGGEFDYTEVSPANFLDWHAESESFEWLAAAAPFSFGYAEQGRSVDIVASMVSDGFFETLGVPALIGRTFFESEYVAGNRAFVISHGLWLRMFGADPAVVGSDITFDGTPITIIGVMPPEFQFPDQEVEIWSPLVRQAYMPEQRASTYWRVVGKLSEGVTPAQAQTEMDAVGADLARRYPESNEGVGIDLRPLREHLIGDVRQPLLVLLAAVGFVLLIACSNVACLMLMRGSQREHEFAVRMAVGAGRLRLVRQLVVESLVLAIVGGAGGLALAAGIQRILPLVSPSDFPRLDYIDLDTTVLMFTAAIATGSALIAGLFPLVRVFGRDVQSRLKESTYNNRRPLITPPGTGSGRL